MSQEFLSVCVIVKNEARYLPEWIAYHQLIGVDHFYVYDNNSEDKLSSALLLFSNFVTLIPWPKSDQQQRAAYRHFFDTYSDRCSWVAIIDADEFIAYKGEGDLRSYLRALSRENAVMMQWVIFGTSGHVARPAGLVIESYTQCHSLSPDPNIKTICRPAAVSAVEITSPHRFAYRDGRAGLAAELGTISVYHYVTRSLEDLNAKMERGDAWSVDRSRENSQNLAQAVKRKLDKYDRTDAIDLYMSKFIPLIQGRLAQLGVAADGCSYV